MCNAGVVGLHNSRQEFAKGEQAEAQLLDISRIKFLDVPKCLMLLGLQSRLTLMLEWLFS